MQKVIGLLLACTMLFGLCACGGGNEKEGQKIPDPVKSEVVSVGVPEDEQQGQPSSSGVTSENESEPQPEPQSEPEPESEPEGDLMVEGMRPEFKESMDSFESFIDDYCAFMKKYEEDPTDISLLSDYLEFMADYESMMEQIDSWSEADLNETELNYYLEVSTRVAEKMLEVAG